MDGYNKIRVIGKGSYGEVWLVKHRRDKKQVRENMIHQNKIDCQKYRCMRRTLRIGGEHA